MKRWYMTTINIVPLPPSTPDMVHQTVIVNGVSKTYSMTGWRIGYAAGPETILKAMGNIQSQSTSNPTSIAQKASSGGLAEEREVYCGHAQRIRCSASDYCGRPQSDFRHPVSNASRCLLRLSQSH